MGFRAVSAVRLNRVAELGDVSTEAFKDGLANCCIHQTAVFPEEDDRDRMLDEFNG